MFNPPLGCAHSEGSFIVLQICRVLSNKFWLACLKTPEAHANIFFLYYFGTVQCYFIICDFSLVAQNLNPDSTQIS